LLITAQFALVGLGVLRDDAAVQAMARSGDRRELLRGPLYYGAMFIVLTLLFWKTRPAGLTALLIMSGGDGLADVVGRRVASPALPWSPRKSLAGSLAVWLGGWLLAGAVLAVYARLEVFSLPGNWFWRLGWIGLLAAVVESLPFRDVDNLTVTLATLLAGLRWL
jgi:phytol kinase